jgi:uncharacterized protein (TIGR01777 family)
MRVFVTGGSGLIGKRLASRLREKGHEPVILSRHADALRRRAEMRVYTIIQGDPTHPGPWQHQVDGCDAVVNLAGHNLFAERWSGAVKAKIRDSRVHGTEQVVAAIRAASQRPKVLLQSSAIGYYGPQGDEELTEASPSGHDFLARVCREWEEAAEPVEALGVRLATIRTGVVLAAGEGALGVMTPIFKLGPGAPVGSGGGPVASGSQWMSWIHLDDIVGLYLMALETEAAVGPINGVAPNPVRNVEFARTLSKVLWKPYAFWRVGLPFGPPDFLLRIMLGEVAEVITRGQKVLPTKAESLGYHFEHPALEEALRSIFAEARESQAEASRPTPKAVASHH